MIKIGILLLFSLCLYASVSDGKAIFAKECASCHVEGKYFAARKKAREWKQLLQADKLEQLHRDKKVTVPYLKTPKFKDDTKDLKALLQKYSKDRGRHNSCY